MINKLEDNEIFVFGSNLDGYHAGGAAKQAKEQFGAIEGMGEGLYGKSYAFPTLDVNLQRRSQHSLKKSRERLYKLVRLMPRNKFLLTPVGTGIAGYKIKVMKKLFANPPINLILPEEFK